MQSWRRNPARTTRFAIDLISTHKGMRKRYGFIFVNRDEFNLKDLKRCRKDSFHWFKKLIASNGESLSEYRRRNIADREWRNAGLMSGFLHPRFNPRFNCHILMTPFKD